MVCLIYKYTNKFNGKVYIGQTGCSVKQCWGATVNIINNVVNFGMPLKGMVGQIFHMRLR